MGPTTAAAGSGGGAGRVGGVAVHRDAHTRTVYATDNSIYQVEPDGVALPRTAAEVRALVAATGRQAIRSFALLHMLSSVPRSPPFSQPAELSWANTMSLHQWPAVSSS